MSENQKEFEKQTPDQDNNPQSSAYYGDINELIVTDKRHHAEGADERPNNALVPGTVGPMDIMMEAVRKGSGAAELEILERMFEFDLKVKAQQAKEAYFQSMADFNKSAPPLKKDKFNKAFQSWYASLENMLNTYRPYLSEAGLSPSFPTPEQDDKTMTCFCRISHELGHSETFSIKAPIDESAIGNSSGKRARNEIQDIKSTFTYLRAATFEAALGVAGTEATQDDDGNAAGAKTEQLITKDQAKAITKRLAAIYGDDPSMFMTWLQGKFGAETIDTIPAKNHKTILKAISETEGQMKAKREPGRMTNDSP